MKVETTAEFPHIIPSHKRFITTQGEGSNLDRAVRNSIQNTFKDHRLKGLAHWSACRRYRYTLWRWWGDMYTNSDNYVNFICLNPSTADDEKDDNTIRKCIKFAKSWGYDSLCVTNLFAYRSTDRKAMLKVSEPVGLDNDYYIDNVANNASLVVAAWSQDGSHLGRSEAVRKMIWKPLHYLRMSKEPWHPLYLPDSTKPILWDDLKPRG